MSGKTPVQVTFETVKQLTIYNIESGNRTVVTVEGNEVEMLAHLPEILREVAAHVDKEES